MRGWLIRAQQPQRKRFSCKGQPPTRPPPLPTAASPRLRRLRRPLAAVPELAWRPLSPVQGREPAHLQVGFVSFVLGVVL